MKVLHIGEYVQGGVATYIKTLLMHPQHPEIEDFLICSDKKLGTSLADGGGSCDVLSVSSQLVTNPSRHAGGAQRNPKTKTGCGVLP